MFLQCAINKTYSRELSGILTGLTVDSYFLRMWIPRLFAATAFLLNGFTNCKNLILVNICIRTTTSDYEKDFPIFMRTCFGQTSFCNVFIKFWMYLTRNQPYSGLIIHVSYWWNLIFTMTIVRLSRVKCSSKMNNTFDMEFICNKQVFHLYM